jgi:nucleotide-binding universal stress UspA family protein
MAEKKPMRLLVAVDGSERSLNAVRYLAQIEAFRRMQLVLFHVFSGVPESFYDLEREPKSLGSVATVRSWEASQREAMQRFMDKARKVLLRAGFAAEAVSVRMLKRKRGIARDIILEAQTGGYHAVVMRRRGLTALRGMILGSVATKLLERLNFIPIILVGREGPGRDILVPVDGSAGSMKAVEFLGSTLSGGDVDVDLLNVIRAEGARDTGALPLLSSEQVSVARGQIQKFMEDARQRLIQRGFAPERIRTEIVTGASSRAGAIVAAARDGAFTTIVMGRSGLSRPRDFFMGRVSNKVIQLAREKTVWVVT